MSTLLRRFLYWTKQFSFIQKCLDMALIVFEIHLQLKADKEFSKNQNFENLFSNSVQIVKKITREEVLDRFDFKVVKLGSLIARFIIKLVLFFIFSLKSSKKYFEVLMRRINPKLYEFYQTIISLIGSSLLAIKGTTLVIFSIMNSLLGSLLKLTSENFQKFANFFGLSKKINSIFEISSNSCSFLVETWRTNRESLVKISSLVLETFVKLFRNNLKISISLVKSVFEIISTFLGTVEFEIYYTPERSIKVVNIFKRIFRLRISRKSEPMTGDSQDEPSDVCSNNTF